MQGAEHHRTVILGDLQMLFPRVKAPPLRSGPARHRVSRALRARNPGRVRKESRKSPPGGTPRAPEECAPESQKSPKRVQNLTFGLFSDSFETSGRTLRGLWVFRPGDFFGTLFGLFRGSGPGDPVPGRETLLTPPLKNARYNGKHCLDNLKQDLLEITNYSLMPSRI